MSFLILLLIFRRTVLIAKDQFFGSESIERALLLVNYIALLIQINRYIMG